MLQLYLAAAFTTVLAAALLGMLLWQFKPPVSSRLTCTAVWLLISFGIMMSPLSYFAFRLPLIHAFEPAVLGTTKGSPNGIVSPTVRDAIRLSYAPLTEEPIKLMPWFVLLIVGVDVRPIAQRRAALAIAIGVSFAIGEIWLVATLITMQADPALAQLPWYAWGGFIAERLLTCFAHTLFVLPTIVLSKKGAGYALLGLLVGMVFHYLGNAPILLAHHRVLGISTEIWSVLIQLWLAFLTLACMLALLLSQYGDDILNRIWQRQMVCPECAATYRQPLILGINLGTWRYEPCGACHKWHWVTLNNLASATKRTGDTSVSSRDCKQGEGGDNIASVQIDVPDKE